MIEFVQDNVQYCVHRKLTKTPTGESVKTQMWHKEFVENNLDREILTIGELKKFDLDLAYEKIDLKNEKDVQENIATLVPNKEVMLATFFLMQESKNIFELP